MLLSLQLLKHLFFQLNGGKVHAVDIKIYSPLPPPPPSLQQVPIKLVTNNA